MKDILSEIVENKKAEIACQKQIVPPGQLRTQAESLERKNRSMKQALAQSPTGIIAEFKRRSPSKGWIAQEAEAAVIPAAYQSAGAAALSILTDEKYFGGNLRDLRTARPTVNLPILRKDFIVDEYQLWQARIAGADAVLLIAACLTPERCAELAEQAHTLSLEVLLEIHSPAELAYAACRPDMLGVNNRNLGTFHTDVQNSFRLAEELKRTAGQEAGAPLLVSESGLAQPETAAALRTAGFRGFLIGETFMKTASPGQSLKDFIKQIDTESYLLKQQPL